MLPVPGTPVPLPVQRPDDALLALRLNQRLVAEVLHIAADHVVLGLEGVPVVARLTSAEQAAVLAEKRTAQFIVRGFTEQGLTLQLVENPGSGPPAAPSAPADVIPNLLRQAGLPVDEAATRIARALIEHGLPVTAELVDELAQALGALKQWGAEDAQRAAALKAAGMPLSPGALALAADHPPAIAASLAHLQAELRALAETPLPPRVAELVQNALRALDRASVNWSAPAPEMADRLRGVLVALGRSLERALAELGRRGQALAELAPQPGLLALAQLRSELARASPEHPHLAAVLNGLDQFLDAARLDHFKNVAPAAVPPEGHWLHASLPLGAPPEHTAQLRVAYRSEGDADAIDPNHTRLVLLVPLEDGQALQVDLSVVERQIGAWVMATDERLRDGAEAELPELQAGLHKLGFTLKTARCDVGRLAPESGPAEAGAAVRAIRAAPSRGLNMEA